MMEDGDGSHTQGDDQALLLDFTLFVDGAVQVSGVGVSRGGGLAAVVTDFERVVVIDPQAAEALGEFSVQLGDLPRQGSTEAISWTADDDLAVLYPDAALVRTYATDGALRAEVDIGNVTTAVHGAMTVDPQADVAYVVAGTGSLTLFGIDLASGGLRSEIALSGDLASPVEGLSLGVEGTPSPMWAITAEGEAFSIDTASGNTDFIGTVQEVGEASGVEAFINPEGEPVLAVSDDDDRYNAEPGPLRLYLFD